MTVEEGFGVGLQFLFAAISAFWVFVLILVIRRVIILRPKFAIAFVATGIGLLVLWLDGKLPALLAILWMGFITWMMIGMFRRVIAPLPTHEPDVPGPPQTASQPAIPRRPQED